MVSRHSPITELQRRPTVDIHWIIRQPLIGGDVLGAVDRRDAAHKTDDRRMDDGIDQQAVALVDLSRCRFGIAGERRAVGAQQLRRIVGVAGKQIAVELAEIAW